MTLTGQKRVLRHQQLICFVCHSSALSSIAFPPRHSQHFGFAESVCTVYTIFNDNDCPRACDACSLKAVYHLVSKPLSIEHKFARPETCLESSITLHLGIVPEKGDPVISELLGSSTTKVDPMHVEESSFLLEGGGTGPWTDH